MEDGKEEDYRKFFRLWILLIFLPRPTHRAVEASPLLGRLRRVERFQRVRLNLFSPTPSGSEPLHRVRVFPIKAVRFVPAVDIEFHVAVCALLCWRRRHEGLRLVARRCWAYFKRLRCVSGARLVSV